MLMTLLFEDRPIQIFQQESLADALRRNGVKIAMGCGGKNRCGGCRIKLLAGTFFSEGKVFEVSAPIVLNACSLRQLSASAKACFPVSDTPQAPRLSLTDMKPIPTEKNILGIDLGTTNIVFALQKNGKVFTGSRINAQIKYGDNIIDRIAFASTPAGRKQLRRALIEETLLPFLKDALKEPETIQAIAVAGNTAMTCFFFDEDPAPLGRSPFQPEKTHFRSTTDALGLDLFRPGTPVYAADCLCGFIGGDISAGLAVTTFGSKEKCELYMDIGTNCEIVLNHHGDFYALSAAAGPAFERFNCRSDHPGNTRHIRFADSGWELFPASGNPAGFCGTGLVDLLAEGFRHGFLDRFGKWQKNAELPESLSLSNDILAGLMTAKAAISSALQLLFQKTNLSPEELDQVFLAGHFAENLDLHNARALGILPRIPLNRFRPCGNAALQGTLQLAALPGGTKVKWENLHAINPAEEPGYQNLFSKALSLDHI